MVQFEHDYVTNMIDNFSSIQAYIDEYMADIKRHNVDLKELKINYLESLKSSIKTTVIDLIRFEHTVKQHVHENEWAE